MSTSSPGVASAFNSRTIALVAIVLVLIIALVYGISKAVGFITSGGFANSENSGQSSESAPAAVVELPGTRVSFIAVGDNVPNDVIASYADKFAGSMYDGEYDYRPLFSQVKDIVSAADLSYIDQETHLGGNDIGPKGYPSFNTTDEMADAVVDTGFDLVASATNHSYDWGYFGAIEHSRSVWNQKPVAFTGTATNWDEASEIPVVERKGITFALLNYTYGINGYQRGEIAGYYVNFIDEDRIRTDVARAKAMADVVLVSMHWGEENVTEPTDDERYYAQLLADLGVDVVLGSHPHVIQPMTWLEGEEGHKTLVCYSLGNFIIQHAAPTPHNDQEGMLSCTFVRHDEEGGDGSITVEEVKWIPLVYHGTEDEYAVWPLGAYTDDLAAKNPAYDEIDDPIAWLYEETNNIVNKYGDGFEIVGYTKTEDAQSS